MIQSCILHEAPLLRMGPTTDGLKRGLGGVALPLLLVRSPVWARLPGRCSMVCFGVFSSVALFTYLWLTQAFMDAVGVGHLSCQVGRWATCPERWVVGRWTDPDPEGHRG